MKTCHSKDNISEGGISLFGEHLGFFLIHTGKGLMNNTFIK
jgi:hypothetical protein